MTQQSTDKKTDLVAYALPAWQALRTYWPAILFIQGIALCVVFSYYSIDGTRGAFARVADLKRELGLFFAAGTTIISGGIIPELIKRVFRPEGVPQPSAGELAHQFVMWAWLGILIDRFYTLQNSLFGEGNDWMTLALKMLADQFIFTPFVSLPLIVLWFLLRETHYNPAHYRKACRLSVIRNRVLPLWTTCLIFWPVMLIIVYSLPAPLQFPLFLLGNAAYSILMIFILRRQPPEPADAPIDRDRRGS